MFSEPYFEAQRDGNCRAHSLNALFGRKVIEAARLTELSAIFDFEYGSKVTEQFDCVQSDSLMLVSYILETRAPYVTHYVPIGCMSNFLSETGARRLEEVIDPTVPALLCFTVDHIWAVRQHGGTWWNLDSMQFRPRRVPSPDYGFTASAHGVVLIYSREEASQRLLPLYQRRVCAYLRAQGLSSVNAIEKWAQGVQKSKELGELETALCCFFRVYGRTQKEDKEYKENMRLFKILCIHYASALPDNVWSVVIPLTKFIVHFVTPS